VLGQERLDDSILLASVLLICFLGLEADSLMGASGPEDDNYF
jgi:hypothetical protein